MVAVEGVLSVRISPHFLEYLVHLNRKYSIYRHELKSRTEGRGRRPMVETEVNRDSKSTNERGPSLVGSLGVWCRYTRFLVCLGCSSQPSPVRVQIFFLTVCFFDSFVPTAQQAGLAAMLGHLSLIMCLCMVGTAPCPSSILATLE